MKKLLFLIIMSLSFMTVAQSFSPNTAVRWVANEIVNESSGFISQELDDDGKLIIVIQYQSHYDFELVRLVWRAFTIQYSDIETVYAWGPANDPGEYYVVIKIDDKVEILMTYNTKQNQSIIFSPK